MSNEYLRREALKQLDGVGDEKRGAIADERGRLSYQVRRRLSEEEEAVIGPACDLRDTDEATQRYQRALRYLPAQLREWAKEEVSA